MGVFHMSEENMLLLDSFLAGSAAGAAGASGSAGLLKLKPPNLGACSQIKYSPIPVKLQSSQCCSRCTAGCPKHTVAQWCILLCMLVSRYTGAPS
jgi:hypothetical protein